MLQALPNPDPDRDPQQLPPRRSASFAIVTLVIGLAAFAGIAWLLLQ